MSSSIQKVSRNQWLVRTLSISVVLWFTGWGSVFALTNTEHITEKTLRDLKIDVIAPEPNIAMSEIYKIPPKIFKQIVGGTPEWKLSYFCKNHTSDELKIIVHEQFASKLFDKKGKETIGGLHCQ